MVEAAFSSASAGRTEALQGALQKMDSTTAEAARCCDQLTRRARQLDSLTSPASDASSMLSRANANLAATLVMMKDAREKFDTVADCEPAIERLYRGVTDMEEKRQQGGKRKTALKNRVVLSEQDVYAAGDSMEILRDTFDYFIERKGWRSAPAALGGLERVHRMGSETMSMLITSHLKAAGQAVRPKRNVKKDSHVVSPAEETAQQTRARLAAALQNRDLLKQIGESEEYQPIEARPIREIRSVFDCLGSHGYHLGPSARREPPGLANIFGMAPNKVVRTEKVGSGCFSSLVREQLKTGFPQLDAYGEARKTMAFTSVDNYYRRIKQDRKKRLEKINTPDSRMEDRIEEADEAARDAVRCLEHAMVVVAGEKNVYRTIVSPSLTEAVDDYYEEEEEQMSPYLKKACVAAYAYVVGSVVDRTLDIIETVFLKEAGIGQSSGSKSGGVALTVEAAASAAAAGLRMLDGVRMLGPSLAKLCEMEVGDGITDPNSSIAAILCIAIHRTTVKNTSRTLENLAKAIQDDPLKGPLHRPKDASVSTVSRDVVRAIRLVAPFVSAYKSVSKRRALPWDPNMGDEAGELDSFVRYLVMRLLNSLKGKALNYTKDGRDDSQAKSNLFMINNAFMLLEELGPGANGIGQSDDQDHDGEHYRIEGSFFVDKINKIAESEKSKYLAHWEALNTHLTAVGQSDIEYQKNESTVLSLESGRLIKQRFSKFNEDFERTYALHKKLCVIDHRLRFTLQQDVSKVFLNRYRRFYDKYTKYRFSKKHQEEYTKYSPDKIEDMLGNLYVDPE